MTTTTIERSEKATWVCDNCRTPTTVLRKRCTECGTSRY
jgi:hypothetical protein